MERKPSRTRAEALLRPKGGQPINLSKDRAAKLRIGGHEALLWCDTYKGRLRLRVVMEEGEVEHITFKQEQG